jgi:hypothetical protein
MAAVMEEKLRLKKDKNGLISDEIIKTKKSI